MGRRICSGLALGVGVNWLSILFLLKTANLTPGIAIRASMGFLFAAVFLLIGIFPKRRDEPTREIRILSSGCELLRLFLLSLAITVVIQAVAAAEAVTRLLPWQGLASGAILTQWLLGLLTAVLAEAVLFWNGMLRIFFVSVQLGLKNRVLAVLFGWIPGLNLYFLGKMIRIVSDEIEVETEKWELDAARAENEVCRTKYPILLVHGVFFRDFRYLNYWGRIPKELQKNGAVIYYGEQQSAASVESCGRELAERIRRITEETGCGKLNIIAHSKGGLDSRAAISWFGAAEYVASLTTINTPHRGCLFAEYLLDKIPQKAREAIAQTYNTTLKKCGDPSPDFLAAVNDLTGSKCAQRNEQLPDAPGILYESVMSYCKKARSGKFPLNISYPLVKRFDGKNDGLVSVESARWGSRFTLAEPKGKRGISHGDMIDLNRENIRGFDVREFYVSLAADLKKRGY